MVVYDARNHCLEIVNLLENRKLYLACTGIDPGTETVLSADAFGNEVRVRVASKGFGGRVRMVTYNLAQASTRAPINLGALGAARNPFESRDPTRRF